LKILYSFFALLFFSTLILSQPGLSGTEK
jgi:hypothetical protein